MTTRESAQFGIVKGDKLEKLKGRLHIKSTDVLVLVCFLSLNLRIINWFESPYILISGDLRPPLVQEAFTRRVMYAWDETDFGIPSIYPPRILDPFYFFLTIFQTFGVNLYLSQIITVFLMFFFSSVLMYMFVRQITNGDTIASLVAALYLTSNVYLINDREVTAIGFIDISLLILPCLITFAKAIKTHSYKLMTVSGILCVLTNATFPNYRTTLICFIMIGLISIFYFLGDGLHIGFHNKKCSRRSFEISLDIDSLRHYLKLLVVFGMAFLLASIWVVALIYLYFDVLNMIYTTISTPWFVGGLGISDVTRLIAKWGVYSGSLGMPYLPYVEVYMSDPVTIILCYLPAILAFSSLFFSKKQKITIVFGSVAIFSLFLASGFSFNEFGNHLYSLLMEIPLLKVFREAANWIFFVIISFSILIGCTVSVLCSKFKGNASRIFILGLVAVLFFSTAYPLATGDVTRNWLNPSLKGSYVPSAYNSLNDLLSSQHWAIMLPQRGDYVVYNFTESPLGCGNPYPLMFSKPIISGVGTEYIQSEYSEVISKLHELMRTNLNYKNIALEGKVSASSIEDKGFEPDKAVDGQRQTRWSSRKGVPQWLQIEWKQPQNISSISITFESAYAESYKVEMWNGSAWAIQTIVENSNSTEHEHVFPQPINTTKLRLYFTKSSRLFFSISIWELEVYARTEGVAKFLGMLGIRYLILEKNIIHASAYNISELKLNESVNFIPIKQWDEVTLFNNIYALQKLYIANNFLTYATLDDMYNSSERLEWNILKQSVFVNSTLKSEITNKALEAPENFVWNELSPTRYEVHLTSKAPFILVFLESFDSQWKLCINNNFLTEQNHLKVNGFANGWLIEKTGNLTITVEYEIQKLLTASVVISIVSPALLLALQSRAELETLINVIHHKLKRKF